MWRPTRAGRATDLAGWSLAALLIAGSAVADGLREKMDILLLSDDGESLRIGTLHTRAQAGGYGFEIELDETAFENHFLSMRPFKCLDGPRLVCHLPYGYELRRVVSQGDLTDLEYDLLFLHKKPGEYGIDPWNGLYYQLEMTARGIEGTVREVDLNVLASPPEAGDLRPIRDADLHEAEAGRHPFPKLVIQ